MQILIKLVVANAFLASAALAQMNVIGSVRDDSGAVPTGVVVENQQQRTPPSQANTSAPALGRAPSAIAPGFSSATAVDPTGAFAFSSVPSGNYFVCAYSLAPGLLSNCEWSSQHKPVAVGTSGSIVVPIVLPRGTVVTLNLQDPNAALPQAPTGGPTLSGSLTNEGHHFYPGVITAAGYYHAARQVSQSGVSHVYAATIPKAVSVRIFIDSDLFITDASGNEVPLRVPSSLSVSGGADTTGALFAK
jgi:hypothetical protein